MTSSINTLELLAPARDYETAVTAIRSGADAVYIGGPSFGARAAAGNSLKDIARLVDYAHKYRVKVYVTLNTILYDNELQYVSELVNELYRIGVDALIVQDLGLLEMDLPPIALHASTQCDTRSAGKARFLEDAGFSQIVLARELSLDEIRNISQNVTVPLEGFVHGALCVSYSGDCQASCLSTGRSANRGECAQMCRLAYDLVDAKGNILQQGKHLLSLKDMNRIDHLKEMADAGISSFKIEGRLKDTAYVKNVVAAYSQALDAVVALSDGKYRRASYGKVTIDFTPDVSKSFNRGFTDYFLTGGERRDAVAMANFASPKWIGEPIGKIDAVKGRELIVSASQKLNNGDGVGYFNRYGKFCGFRVNRVEGKSVFTAQPVNVKPGTPLYRNADKVWDDLMARPMQERRIRVNMTLRHIGNGLVALKIDDERGCSVELTEMFNVSEAKSPQCEQRRRVLSRLGDTVYTLATLNDNAGNIFIAASALAELRRIAVERLDASARMTYKYDYRRAECHSLQTPGATTYHDNIANRMAEAFYKKHGTVSVAKAVEVVKPRPGDDVRVMTTRYCLRREMGACLRKACASKLPQGLYLKAPAGVFRLDFDCRNCEMQVIKVAQISGN